MKKISVFVLFVLTVLIPFDLHAITSEDIENIQKESQKAEKENLKPIGKIWFKEPRDGQTVKNPIKFCFESQGLKVVQWGRENNQKEGHHHLLIDITLTHEKVFSLLSRPISMIHQSDGQSCDTLRKKLSPGERTISGLFTKNDHTPYIPGVITSIKINVEK